MAAVLQIDLSRKSFQFEEIPGDIVRKYIGGRGIASYLLYQGVPARADPLSAENHLIYSAGIASGTGYPFSSKVCLVPQRYVWLLNHLIPVSIFLRFPAARLVTR